jgi:hypothetical protein
MNKVFLPLVLSLSLLASSPVFPDVKDLFVENKDKIFEKINELAAGVV